MDTYQRDVAGCSFEACLRRHEDILMRHCCYALLRCRHDVQIRCCGDVPPRHHNNIPLRRRWVFHLRRTRDVAGTYREMSLRCCHNVLLLGGNRTNLKYCQKNHWNKLFKIFHCFAPFTSLTVSWLFSLSNQYWHKPFSILPYAHLLFHTQAAFISTMLLLTIPRDQSRNVGQCLILK